MAIFHDRAYRSCGTRDTHDAAAQGARPVSIIGSPSAEQPAIETTPTQRLMRAYEEVFRYFNDSLVRRVLGIELPPPILTFSRSTRKNALAFFASESWRAPEKSERLCEIAVVPEHTADDPREVFSSIVHEMLHYVDFLAGTAPKTRGYHGRSWFVLMEQIGLPGVQISPKSRIAVSHEILSGGPFDTAYQAIPKRILLPFIIALDEAKQAPVPPTDGEAEKEPSKSGKRFKYLCTGCETTMRGPSGKHIGCIDCNIPFEEVGP